MLDHEYGTKNINGIVDEKNPDDGVSYSRIIASSFSQPVLFTLIEQGG